ncbi:MAG: septal ring lytic transglycosylase RlpA family protein [Patescibacteria group bacterium]|jgi:hypothetical protein
MSRQNVFILSLITWCVSGWITPVMAQDNNVTRLAIGKKLQRTGYTLRNTAGTFAVGMPADSIVANGKSILKLRQVTQVDQYPLNDERLIGDLYTYKLQSKTDNLQLTKPVWLELSFPDSERGTRKIIKHWNFKKQRWEKMVTRHNKGELVVRSQWQRTQAVIGVFARKVQLGNNIVEGQASWYNDSTGVACNDFPLGSTVRVVNIANGKYVDATIISTGPYVTGRVVDLSADLFEQLASLGAGVINVTVQLVRS